VLHDVRAPLSGIQALTEALEDDLLGPADTAHCLRRLEALAQRLLHLTRDIAPDADGWETTRVPLGALVRDAVVLASVIADVKGVTLTVACADETAHVVVAPPRIIRAVDNILGNAVRHSQPGSTIRIDVDADPDAGSIHVTDTCGGITPQEMERIFDRSFQGQAGDIGSAGMGLFIARTLVEEQGGSISVKNRRSGCRFTLRLPVAAAGA
jgi:signal transduction histidine kinase